MTLKKINREDLEPLLESLAIFGTGGGGSPDWGRGIILNDFKRGREYTIIDPKEVEDDAVVVSGGIMGSVKMLDNMNFYELLEYWENNFELEVAFREMEKELSKKIDYIVPFEMGGLNTPIILSLGARVGIPVIDGDALGRAAPETQMTSFIGYGISLTPMPLVDHVGNVMVVRKTVNPVYPDQIGRFIVTRGGGLVANNHYPMSGRQLKNSVIPNTISKAIKIGKSLINARNNSEDPIDVFRKIVSGINIFHGKVIEINEEESEGFYFTKVKLIGLEKDINNSCEIVIKNETMICWKNGELQVVFPDLLCMLEPKTGRGIMSIELKANLKLKLLAIPCHKRLREALKHPDGKAAFSSKRYGQNIKYVPLEKLH
ncbi:MAG TPA: DUF917 domain-containing protein [Candidatus Atribacteria bacterium]|nr:DUF917 domain-containing protein [Candidatus Atribacteria bacterium]